MATSNHPKLDTLPVELLQRIAGFLPCSSALRLIQVSRALRNACNDHFVFKDIARTSHLGFNPPNSVSVALLEGKSILETKQAAFAVENAVDWYTASKGFDPSGMPDPKTQTCLYLLANPAEWKQIRLWLPQLIALHHPCALQLNPVGIWEYLKLFQGVTWGQERGFCSLAFSFIAAVLEQNAVFEASSWEVRHNILTRAVEGLEDMIFLNFHRPNSGFNQISTFLDMNQYHYSMAVIAQYARGMINSPENTSRWGVPLPQPSRIPFHKFMDMPRLMHLCEDPEDVNLFPHIDFVNLWRSGFLCSGEWVGYYSYDRMNRSSDIPWIDPPMRSIVFSPRADIGVGAIESLTGVDSIGPFTLMGHLSEMPRGRVALHMTKSYYFPFQGGNPTHSWEWEAFLTPFGIVGAWGGTNPDAAKGHIWLWKMEWCSEDWLSS
ncbi:uncharacterized protein BDZ99DRAFT_465503 [Mytilinidion resinicola]|uniref:F-box domain-containing protein n=1 Tax=Mytilinidion resinicola TaxID=574789 RepID=A0A6A6YDS6_9PEZI|nr:uncharacterized protein BDZ99DRAFT_465503 [Mytilinidion resinicola]KAF2806708.1 hypothetical protein BDZ99DRAFT_465503 [Mytilinidion resinicola]